MAQKEGMIGITTTNARASIAPTHGVASFLGTNPLTWAMPSDDGFPVGLDCATSVSQRGKIEKYARDGVPTPAGLVIDRNGLERTDTNQILQDLQTGQCSLAPLGGMGEDLGGKSRIAPISHRAGSTATN
jgi:L-2-hydroxycarboxylate dehydrogenase (NAD+)